MNGILTLLADDIPPADTLRAARHAGLAAVELPLDGDLRPNASLLNEIELKVAVRLELAPEALAGAIAVSAVALAQQPPERAAPLPELRAALDAAARAGATHLRLVNNPSPQTDAEQAERDMRRATLAEALRSVRYLAEARDLVLTLPVGPGEAPTEGASTLLAEPEFVETLLDDANSWAIAAALDLRRRSVQAAAPGWIDQLGGRLAAVLVSADEPPGPVLVRALDAVQFDGLVLLSGSTDVPRDVARLATALNSQASNR